VFYDYPLSYRTGEMECFCQLHSVRCRIDYEFTCDLSHCDTGGILSYCVVDGMSLCDW
jgi:hypothetical protein